MANLSITSRRAYRRTDDHTPRTLKVKLVAEALPLPLAPISVLIKVYAVSLNYRDANIANSRNPWPVVSNGIPCNDAAGEIVAVGDGVKNLILGDLVAPIVDTENITGRESTRSWLAADEDGVLADYLGFDEEKLCTGGVSMFALKLARAAGLKVILSSSSDGKLKDIKERFSNPPLLTINYVQNSEWHEDVLKHTDNAGVDLIIEVGGSQSLVKSMKCTRRGGTISQVVYPSKQNLNDLADLLPLVIGRRVVLRGTNAGSKHDIDDLCTALSATQMRFDDIIVSVFTFDKADEAIEYIWQSQQLGKLVIRV